MPVLVGVLMAVALVGCNKKPPKKSGPDVDPGAAPAPAQPDVPTAPGNSGGGGGGIIAAGGIGVVVNPSAALGGGGGGGAAMAVRKAAKRAATNNELHQIHLFIESASAASGQMPSPQETLAALQREAPKIAEAIKEGVIVLTPARSREEIWAYEAIALEQGGQVLTNTGIERMDADTLKRRLGVR
jgi:hypothetical protein